MCDLNENSAVKDAEESAGGNVGRISCQLVSRGRWIEGTGKPRETGRSGGNKEASEKDANGKRQDGVYSV